MKENHIKREQYGGGHSKLHVKKWYNIGIPFAGCILAICIATIRNVLTYIHLGCLQN